MGLFNRRSKKKKLADPEAPSLSSTPPRGNEEENEWVYQSSLYGASRARGGYSHSNDDYYNNNNHYYSPPPPPLPPRYDYYVPAPEPRPPAHVEPQQPWSRELYRHPPPMSYVDPPRPAPPFQQPHHFFEPPPQRSSVFPASEESGEDCKIM